MPNNKSFRAERLEFCCTAHTLVEGIHDYIYYNIKVIVKNLPLLSAVL